MPGLQTLYQLQIAALERAGAARRLCESEQGLGESAELRSARDALQGEEAGLAGTRARVRDLELDLQDLAAKIAANEKRLWGGEVRNPKELESLQDDLRSLRSRRDGLEDGVLAGLDETDERQARLEKVRAEFAAIRDAWEREQARLTALVADLRGQVARLDERIAQLRAAVPAPLIEQYDELCRKKGGRGIAAIRSGLCEGCRVQVPTGIAQQVRRGDDDSICCRNCGRILCVVQ